MHENEREFLWLLKWYKNQCDIHTRIVDMIKIDTIDNPGWALEINLQNTLLKDQIFKKVKIDRTEDNWIFCCFRNYIFEAACGSLNLIECLANFREWATSFQEKELKIDHHPKIIPINFAQELERLNNKEDDFSWLIRWRHTQCNGDWEHSYGVHISTLYSPGWAVLINLQDTVEELQNKEFDEVAIKRTDQNWLFCRVRKSEFEARCGALNLPEVINIFRKWVTSFEE